MLTVALTGGIASGKTVVLQVAEGFPEVKTVQADRLAREIYRPDNPMFQEVVDLLGEEVLDDDGGIDPSKVGELVFEDKELLRKLEKIAHPYVRKRIEEIVDSYGARDTGLLMIEIPLLFQSSRVDLDMFDYIVLVTVETEVRIERLMERDGMSEEKAKTRIELQALPADARERADFVIETGCSVEGTRQRAKRLISGLLD